MSTERERNAAKFDGYAAEYGRLHAKNLNVTGEDPEYFYRYKVDCLTRAGVTAADRILDFGCGIGNVTTLLARRFTQVSGYEPSAMSAETARRRAPTANISTELQDFPDGGFSVALLSGVLHHVAPRERVQVVQQVHRKLEPGGRVFVFEHNPLNPVTRYAVQTCEFDDDAVLLWPWQVKQCLERGGFADPEVDYIVFFPRALARLRPLEPRLRWLPLGGQTLTSATKRA